MATPAVKRKGIGSAAMPPHPGIRLYKPLKSWETRLVRLLPAEDKAAPLHCELVPAAVVAAPGLGIAMEPDPVQYTALSYSWGYPELEAQVTCNGFIIGVGPPLASALRAMRYTNKPRWVWCDAICLYQQDPDEKAAQVKQMLLIFSKAESVLAWLGDDEPGVETLVRVVSAPEKTPNEPSAAGDAALLATATRTAKDLLQRQFFSRTWIRQEIFAAKYLAFRIGHYAMSLEAFTQFLDQNQITTSQMKSMMLSYNSARGLIQQKAPSTMTSKAYSVLRDNHHFNVSLDQDRIYALMGMMDTLATQDSDAAARKRHDQLQSFQIDYQEDVEAIYTRFIKFLIASDGNLNCLEVFGSRQSVPNLPSWSTDWRPSAYCYSCSQDAYKIPRYFMDSLPPQFPPKRRKRPNQIGGGQPMLEQTVLNELHVLGYQLGVVQQGYRVFKPGQYAWRTEIEYTMKYNHDKSLNNEAEGRRGQLDKLIQMDKMKAVLIESAAAPNWRDRLQKLTGLEEVCGVLVDSGVRGGDIVVQLMGSRMVHILRPSQSQGKYSLVTAGWYWCREGRGLSYFVDRAALADLDDKFEPREEISLWGTINGFALKLAPGTKIKRDFGRCTTFRNTVLEVVGMSKDIPDVEVPRPEPTLFKLV